MFGWHLLFRYTRPAWMPPKQHVIVEVKEFCFTSTLRNLFSMGFVNLIWLNEVYVFGESIIQILVQMKLALQWHRILLALFLRGVRIERRDCSGTNSRYSFVWSSGFEIEVDVVERYKTRVRAMDCPSTNLLRHMMKSEDLS